jgi:hypothetical protein
MTIFCQPPWPSDTSRVWKRLAESVSFGLSVQAIGRNSNSQRNTEKKFGQYCWRKKALFKINSSSKSRKAITDTVMIDWNLNEAKESLRNVAELVALGKKTGRRFLSR